MTEVEFMWEIGDYEVRPVLIREDELSSLTAADLRALHISRERIYQVFAEARELMRDVEPRDRVRPCADLRLDGGFDVNLVGYSDATDPLLRKRPLGRC